MGYPYVLYLRLYADTFTNHKIFTPEIVMAIHWMVYTFKHSVLVDSGAAYNSKNLYYFYNFDVGFDWADVSRFIE